MTIAAFLMGVGIGAVFTALLALAFGDDDQYDEADQPEVFVDDVA